LVLTRFLKSLRFEVKVGDPETYLLVAFMLCAVALVASFIPAYRVTKVDPVNAVREE
jgi:putative ABC transport system permease protein